jgi:F-type H+-transporting ATPase subunit a
MAGDAHSQHDPLDPNHLFGHVQDATYFEVPRNFTPDHSGKIFLPQPLAKPVLDPDGHPVTNHSGEVKYQPVWATSSDSPLMQSIVQPLDFKFTKFMAIELAVALIICVLFMGLAAKIRHGGTPRGRLWNMLEVFLLFLRDQVALPAIGSHDVKRFAPLIWTVFFFVLGCNLMGMLPWLGSPTGAFATTTALALVVFSVVVGAGIAQLGMAGFLKSLVPHMDLPGPVMIFLWPMVFAIEIFGLLVKHFVLAVRLLANMIGGHVVLAVLLAFITLTANSMLYWGVMPASVLGATALSLLELLVAFIQAYIFAFLTALFIGTAVHPH